MENKKKIVISGIRTVTEAIHHGKEIEIVYFQKDSRKIMFKELFTLIRKQRIPFQFVPKEKLNRLTDSKHRGVAAKISPIVYRQFDELLKDLIAKKSVAFLLILDRITDVRNFGSIVRTAEGAGVDGVIIPYRNAAKINSQAIKSSAGAMFNIPICRELNLKNVIKTLKHKGFQIVAATEKGEKLFTTVDFTQPTVLIMGSEDKGIEKRLLSHSHECIKIPMKGNVSSLNVSVATAIILFEAIRQRMKA